MIEIIAHLQILYPHITQTTIRQLGIIIAALLSMTGRVTMLGISRWAGKGGSYRTVQRFFHTAIPWYQVMWLFFKEHIYQEKQEYILAGDETVVTKSGHETHGLDRFFSSIYQRVVPGLAFFGLSLVSVADRRSYPVQVKQVIRDEAAKKSHKAAKKKGKKGKKKGKRGRPKGSKNKDKRNVELNPELVMIQEMVRQLLGLIRDLIPLTYFVLDGHFGHNAAAQMVRQCGLQIVSKLKCNSALYWPYDGPYTGGRPRQYGDKINYAYLPETYLKTTTIEDGIRTQIYQVTVWHKDFPDKLNVVIIVKHNFVANTWAHLVLFSTDLTLAYDRLIDFYRLRFQIEFNFRDAKQFWGLEDFMNVKPVAVTNAANLSLFMVTVSQLLLRHFRAQYADFNVLDLKAHFRGHKYVVETLKLLPQMPDEFLLHQIFDHISRLGSVHL